MHKTLLFLMCAGLFLTGCGKTKTDVADDGYNGPEISADTRTPDEKAEHAAGCGFDLQRR